MDGFGVFSGKNNVGAAAAAANLREIARIGRISARWREDHVEIPLRLGHYAADRSPPVITFGA